MRKLTLVWVLLLVACAGKPMWYGEGVRWTAPIVAPLEAEPVVVPVMVHGKGPYLFLLDPDAKQSGIDDKVAAELNLYAKPDFYINRSRENDTVVKMTRYEALKMQVGDLTINNAVLAGVAAGTLEVRGQRIHGYFGRDLLSDTVIIEIDRDRGWVMLALEGHENKPAPARHISGHLYDGRLRINVMADGKTLDMIVDMGAKISAVWPALLQKFGWPLSAASELTVDETGHHKMLNGLTDGHDISLSEEVQAASVAFVVFDDQRSRERDVDGHIGQNVLARYHMVFDRSKRVLILADRARDLGTNIQDRVTRWGNTFQGCRATGCATLAMIKAKAEGDTAKLVVIVDAAARAQAVEFFLEGLDENNKPVTGPLLRLTVSKGLPQATVAVPADLAKATSFRVVDITPFPTSCDTTACLTTVAR